MKKIKAVAAAASISMLATGVLANGAGVTAVDSLSLNVAGSISITDTVWYGPTFTAGAGNYSINELTFRLTSAQDNSIRVSLYALDPGTNLPTGNALATTVFTGVDGFATISDAQLGDLASAVLASGQGYALILSAVSGSFNLLDNDGPQNAYTFSEGFTSAGDGFAGSVDSGNNWSGVALTPIFRLKVVLANLINSMATRQSMMGNAMATRKVFALQASSVNPGLSQDCAIFDERGICVGFTGKYTSVGGSSVDAASGALTLAYKLNPQIRFGGYIEQRTGDIVDQGVRVSNGNPDFGLFGVWSEREDGQGLQVRAAVRQGKQDLTITRSDVLGAEAGTGSSQLRTQGAKLTVSRGYQVNPNWLAKPYVGLRDIRITRDGYTETSAVTTPLTYTKLTQESTQLLLGVNFSGKVSPKVTFLGAVGLEHDLKVRISDYSATGVTGLQAIEFDTNLSKTRPVVSAGLVYSMDKAKQLGAQVVYRKEAFSNSPTTTALVTFNMGF